MRASAIRIAAVIAVVVALAVVYWLLQETGVLATIVDGAALRQRVVALGNAGPLVVIALMVLAIMVSPIPSAPIAVAAGAAYGHGWGMLYVLLGAELGALAAFGLARLLGRDTLQRWFGDRLPVGWLGSRNVLMTVVFASCLVAVDKSGNVFVADFGNNRIEKWRPGIEASPRGRGVTGHGAI